MSVERTNVTCVSGDRQRHKSHNSEQKHTDRKEERALSDNSMIELVRGCREKQNGSEQICVSQIRRGGVTFFVCCQAMFCGLGPLFLHLVGKPRVVKFRDKGM